jgi:hypothetical protein
VRFGFTEPPGFPQQIRQIVVCQTVAIVSFKQAAASALRPHQVASLIGFQC